MKSNQVFVRKLPLEVFKAQELTFQAYGRLCSGAPALTYPAAIKFLGNSSPIFSLTLSGPDGLAKSALLTAASAYAKTGDSLIEKLHTRMNVLIRIQDAYEFQELKEAARSAQDSGHSQVMIMVKGS